jgi:indolepyruvate ferredoxin oxidoreductase
LTVIAASPVPSRSARSALTSYDLAAALTQAEGRIFLTGLQALVRLPIMQRLADRRRGWATAGLISGYRGSPLGGYDQQLWRAKALLDGHDVRFHPGLNEDLAATHLWGAQMLTAFGPAKVDGVFGFWYGKGPGVDRTGDVFRNANILGASAKGGVVAFVGDDHGAQSSMFPHQTDGIFQSVQMPILQPANVEELIALGLAGIALSRYSGLWVAMKTITEVVESAGTVDVATLAQAFQTPTDALPVHGLNWDPLLAWPQHRNELERRLVEERLPAAQRWAMHNQLDRVVARPAAARLGLVTVGKAHYDAVEAVRLLRLENHVAIYKVAMSWPLATPGVLAFARDLDAVIVVEEKRGFVESQIKDAAFNLPADQRPSVFGKSGPGGAPLLRQTLELSPLDVARAVFVVADALGGDLPAGLQVRLADLECRARPPQRGATDVRRPYFCAGCPHNRSTRSPDGSIAGGGIGCHVMALAQPDLRTSTFSQMGGEGAQWIGAAPFSQTGHIFQNLGDGTYQHSGILAVRAAVAAKANITFKVLFNDAVAMTGGQPAEGSPTPVAIVKQLLAEGVARVALVSDAPERWTALAPPAVDLHHRDDFDAVQRDLRQTAGVTAIVYDQVCASEKRRRAKKQPTPTTKRLYINPAVCEGCGDCSIQSNCIAIEPLATERGVKRAINQSACNTDFSCVRGFCPSFVEIEGAVLAKPATAVGGAAGATDLPVPTRAAIGDEPYNVYIAGIGGLGVLTLGAILGVAAHLDGLAVRVLDFTGLAQKNGAVVSQVRIARHADNILTSRVPPQSVDVLIGADLVVSAAPDALMKLCAQRSVAIVNDVIAPTADFVANRDAVVDRAALERDLRAHAKSVELFPAHAIVAKLFGETTVLNTFLLGFAWQKGKIPLSLAALRRSIELNGAIVQANLSAFEAGRAAAIGALTQDAPSPSSSVDEEIAACANHLRAYQDDAYAQHFLRVVERGAEAERRCTGAMGALTLQAAQSLRKLMAYKDEYEVARLYAAPDFRQGLARQFSSNQKLSVWLAPPLISGIDPSTNRPRKRKFGPWIFVVFRLLAALKPLRRSRFDPFGWTAERREERRMRETFQAQLLDIAVALTPELLSNALRIASWPMDVRGFGVVRRTAIDRAQPEMIERLSDRANESPDAAVVHSRVQA